MSRFRISIRPRGRRFGLEACFVLLSQHATLDDARFNSPGLTPSSVKLAGTQRDPVAQSCK